MTVIAYRRGVLAGDSCWSEDSGLLVNIQNKILRLPSGALYGGAGAPDDRSLLSMLVDVRKPVDLPKAKDLADPTLADIECILVLPDRSVWTIAGGPEGYGLCPVSMPFCAIGAGRELAMGAMAMRATAEEAVQAACDWHRSCREPIHTLTLKRGRTK